MLESKVPMSSKVTLFLANRKTLCFLLVLIHTLPIYTSLRGGHLKGKGKEVLGATVTPEARKEGGKETPAMRLLYFSFLTSTRRM